MYAGSVLPDEVSFKLISIETSTMFIVFFFSGLWKDVNFFKVVFAVVKLHRFQMRFYIDWKSHWYILMFSINKTSE